MTNAADSIWHFADGTPTLPVARNPLAPLDFAARYELHIAGAVAMPAKALARRHELDHMIGDAGCALAIAWCAATAAPRLRSDKPAAERHQTSLCGSAQHADGGHHRCSVHDPVEPPPPGRHPLIAQRNSLLLRWFRLPAERCGCRQSFHLPAAPRMMVVASLGTIGLRRRRGGNPVSDGPRTWQRRGSRHRVTNARQRTPEQETS
jgi:hypothetical protein